LPVPPPPGFEGPDGALGAGVGAFGPDGLAGPVGPAGAEPGGATGTLAGGAVCPIEALAVAPTVSGITIAWSGPSCGARGLRSRRHPRRQSARRAAPCRARSPASWASPGWFLLA